MVAAQQTVTAGQIGQGRFGLNVVCGRSSDEFDIFGINLVQHEERYDRWQGWTNIRKRV